MKFCGRVGHLLGMPNGDIQLAHPDIPATVGIGTTI
jgi:hypothetical protein